MIALLDVNVLVALFDPSHNHHEPALTWFASHRKSGWATCALTENALMRILSDARYPGIRVPLVAAVARLQDFCSAEEHVFWPDSVSVRDRDRFRWNQVQGHGQITDVYLLALSVTNRGCLVTFDSAISLRTVSGATNENLEIIPS